MAVAEIITIGTELLLGEIIDTNTRAIARALRKEGFELYRTTTVGDNIPRIAQALLESLSRADFVITTGGLGPTQDDPTREAFAQALDAQLVFHSHLWKQILDRFTLYGRKATENNRRQAYIPSGAVAIPNPVGTAPAFYIFMGEKLAIALPGVPSEMEYLLEHEAIRIIREKYPRQSTIQTRILHVAGIGESMVDERIADLERLSNPTVGLAAHSGQIDIRIAAKSESLQGAQELIKPVEEEIRSRLGDWIYGEDELTLEKVLSNLLDQVKWDLKVNSKGLGRGFSARIKHLNNQARSPQYSNKNQLCRGTMIIRVKLLKEEFNHRLKIRIQSPHGEESHQLSYVGPPGQVSQWGCNIVLDHARKVLLTEYKRINREPG